MTLTDSQTETHMCSGLSFGVQISKVQNIYKVCTRVKPTPSD